ncbi:MAG TPA: 4'-phosphopantetheinyl transferase superfamily protein [Thermomicrobiaceae bacterium]|nr:4'-phosphopantetheinyl transferase superfamily protein [Thermomicrobiaceae bacterium]
MWVTRAELAARARTSGDSFLHLLEREDLATIRDPRRRESWLLGRLLAKELIQERLGLSVAVSSIAIHSRDGAGRAVRPWAMLDGRPLPLCLSIAHTDRSVAAACVGAPVTVGVDLTPVGALGSGAAPLWFSGAERAWCAGEGEVVGALRRAALWAVKEAGYKATNRGEAFAPRRYEVRQNAGGQPTLTVAAATAPVQTDVWVTERDGEIAAVVIARGKDMR